MASNKNSVAKHLIVRYIQDKGLKKNDRLPSVDFFRRRFRCGTTTVAKAINELREEGILDVYDKIGVFVCDPNVGGHSGRVIGISMFMASMATMYNIFLGCLQQELNNRGCTVKLFFLSKPLKKDKFEFHYKDFPGLARSLEEHSIDGLIHFGKFDKCSMKFIASNEIPEVFSGFLADDNANCCVCDMGDVLKSMFRCEAVKSAKRPLAFIPPSAADEMVKVFQAETGGKGEFKISPRERDDSFSYKIAEELSKMPEKTRPDMLLFFDDFLASAVLFNMSIKLSEKNMPGAALLLNHELPIAYPRMNRLLTWRIDINKFAKLTAEKLIETLRSGGKDVGVVYYEPEFSDMSIGMR